MSWCARGLWLVMALSFALGCQAQPDPSKVMVIRALATYDLAITQIAQPALVENDWIDISFDLKVGTGLGNVAAKDLAVCGGTRMGPCVQIPGATAGRSYRGVVHTTAPRAAAQAPIRIVLIANLPCSPGIECFGEEELTDATSVQPVAARYVVRVDGFTINHTRAIITDTVVIALQGKVLGQRSDAADACSIQAPPAYCVGPIPQGNFKNGVFAARNVEVGPFEMIPDVSGDLAFTYLVLNFGTPYEQRVAQKIFDGISGAASAFMQAYSGNSGWSSVDDFTKKINALQFGGCDGPVALDGVSFLNKSPTVATVNQTLEMRTWANGRVVGSRSFEIDSQDGCGRSPRYGVRFSVVRTSWRSGMQQ
jgi:hypothetical protein